MTGVKLEIVSKYRVLALLSGDTAGKEKNYSVSHKVKTRNVIVIPIHI